MLDFYKHTYKYGYLAFKDKSGCLSFFNKNPNIYQEYINDEFKKYYVPNTNILDIGSNIGIFTVSFSKIALDCEIHSFEPVNITNKLLTKSIELNEIKNVKIYNCGLSDDNRKVKINVHIKNLGNSSINQNYEHIPVEEVTTENIKIKKLDDLKINNISFIKVDIQEHELDFLKGAKETLKNNNATIILEIPIRNEHEIKIHNKCVKLMKEYGYNHYRICNNANKDYIFRKSPF